MTFNVFLLNLLFGESSTLTNFKCADYITAKKISQHLYIPRRYSTIGLQKIAIQMCSELLFHNKEGIPLK